MDLAYNTNGFAHHRLDDALAILADLGYAGVALTPDIQHLDPLTSGPADVERVRRRLESLGLSIVIESGARFALDPRQKHHPSLLSCDGYARRQDYYRRLVDLAQALCAPLVSIWSGRAENDTPAGDAALALLAERLKPVLDYAKARAVTIAFEPEPGMRVDRLADYCRLAEQVERDGRSLALTIDVGHLAASEEPPFERHLGANADRLASVQLDDSPRGVHEHRFFGDGVVDFRAIAAELARIGYRGPLAVELSRHSHDAVATARRAVQFLRDHGF